MPYTDLLRLTVFLTAAEATALGAIAVLAAGANDDHVTLLVAAGSAPIAVVTRLFRGRRSGAADGVREALGGARVATSLPDARPASISSQRLWPIALTAIGAGAL